MIGAIKDLMIIGTVMIDNQGTKIDSRPKNECYKREWLYCTGSSTIHFSVIPFPNEWYTFLNNETAWLGYTCIDHEELKLRGNVSLNKFAMMYMSPKPNEW